MSLLLERNLSHYLSVLAICILTRYSSGELDGEFAAGVRGSSAHVTRHLGPAELCHEDWMQLKEKMQQAKAVQPLPGTYSLLFGEQKERTVISGNL